MKRKDTFRRNKFSMLIFIAFIFLGIYFSIKFALIGEKKLDLSSKNVYLYNLTDDKEEFKFLADKKVAPASLTKIMTTIVALEHIDDLSAAAPIDVASYKEMVERNSSMAGFYGRETTSFRDLLYGTMLASGGECANSLAIDSLGSKETFVKAMNQKAEELGLKNTHFQNPDGLDEDNHYSSAKDLAMLLKYALENGHFRAIFTKTKYHSTSTNNHPDGIDIKSTVLTKAGRYDQKGFKIIGGKSGTTYEAGNCWASLVEKNGKEYICVVLGSPIENLGKDEGHIFDTLKLMEKI